MRSLNITSCEQCPYLSTELIHTGDSFERPIQWSCENKKGKGKIGVEEDREKPKIPDWCPLPRPPSTAKVAALIANGELCLHCHTLVSDAMKDKG